MVPIWSRNINAFERFTIELPDKPERPAPQGLLARWRSMNR